jgi:hypothetical protein
MTFFYSFRSFCRQVTLDSFGIESFAQAIEDRERLLEMRAGVV